VADAMRAVYDEVLRRQSSAGVAAELAVVDQAVDSLIEVLQAARGLREPLVEAAELIARSLAGGGQLLVCGNGGSAAESQHFAAELVGRFRDGSRPGYAVHALTADSAVLTAWANDRSYAEVFARQVEAFGRPGDVLVGLSTSGRSRNVLRAFHAARQRGLRRVALIGRDGGPLRRQADIAVVVPSADTARVQECQGLFVHLLSELVERRLVAATGGADGSADGPRVRPLAGSRQAA
jgi:D-inositol-3-phosphate glycosyltransferase